jgi:hypothetical protein
MSAVVRERRSRNGLEETQPGWLSDNLINVGAHALHAVLAGNVGNAGEGEASSQRTTVHDMTNRNNINSVGVMDATAFDVDGMRRAGMDSRSATDAKTYRALQKYKHHKMIVIPISSSTHWSAFVIVNIGKDPSKDGGCFHFHADSMYGHRVASLHNRMCDILQDPATESRKFQLLYEVRVLCVLIWFSLLYGES